MSEYYSVLENTPSTRYDENIPILKITSKTKWYIRLYYTITNPFTYLFNGTVRY